MLIACNALIPVLFAVLVTARTVWLNQQEQLFHKADYIERKGKIRKGKETVCRFGGAKVITRADEAGKSRCRNECFPKEESNDDKRDSATSRGLD